MALQEEHDEVWRHAVFTEPENVEEIANHMHVIKRAPARSYLRHALIVHPDLALVRFPGTCIYISDQFRDRTSTM